MYLSMDGKKKKHYLFQAVTRDMHALIQSGGSGGLDPPLEFWQKCGDRIREWDQFDIAQHLC